MLHDHPKTSCVLTPATTFFRQRKQSQRHVHPFLQAQPRKIRYQGIFSALQGNPGVLLLGLPLPLPLLAAGRQRLEGTLTITQLILSQLGKQTNCSLPGISRY